MVKQSGTRAKGEGSVFQDKNGTWVATIETGVKNGKRQRKRVTGKTRAIVQTKLRTIQRQQDAGKLTTINLTVSEWLTYWLEEICPTRIQERTLYGYTRCMELYVLPHIGNIKLTKLTTEHIRKVHSEMRKQGLCETTVRQTHAILSRALKVAVREDKIDKNVASLVDSPSPRRNPHPVLSTDDARRVIAGAQSPRELARLTIALVLGLRQGEALGLKWSDIDLGKGLLSVERAAQRLPGKGITTKAPKTAASNRVIPLPRPAIAVLQAWKQVTDEPDGYVFHGYDLDKPDETRNDWTMWKVALERAGVPGVPLHGARGTAASLLLEMGVPERVIADILGHANVNVTMQHYLHSDEHQRGMALDGLADRLAIAPLE